MSIVGSVEISNADRLVFPEAGITKGALADYYARIAGTMLPWIRDRPISLLRCPRGRAEACFFQKHDKGGFGEAVRHVDIREKGKREKGRSAEPYLYMVDAEGLLACVQMGTIEFHGWGACVSDIERPDRMVFDLDPDEGLAFDCVRAAAREVGDCLSAMGLASFPLLTGGKGVHVVVPLLPDAQWPAVRSFARRFAADLAARAPDRFTARLSREKRKGRIFIDWLRNQRGSTAIMPWSVRAREGAPVAMPVSWEELGANIASSSCFTLAERDTVFARAGAGPLSGWGVGRQHLPDR